MMYLWPQASSLQNFPRAYGVLTTPSHGSIPLGIQEGRMFGVDTGLKGKSFSDRWWTTYQRYLHKLHPYLDQCVFVVVPDLYDCAAGSYTLYEQLAGEIAAACDSDSTRLAYVAQDGAEDDEIPMCVSVVFLGGTPAWRLGPGGRQMIAHALAEGKRVHVGAVNSIRRFRQFEQLGCHSADGTTAIYNPTTARRRLDRALSQPSFFGG